MSNTEQTLSIIKPDAVERNLDNEIKQMFIKNGFNITSIEYKYSLIRDDGANERIYEYDSDLTVTLKTSLGDVVVTESKSKKSRDRDSDVYPLNLLYGPIINLRSTLPEKMAARFGD